MHDDDRPAGTILNRRVLLGMFGGALLGNRMAWGAPALVVSPEMTEGPFFVDERIKRSDLTTNTNNPNVANGMPLDLRITVGRLAGNRLAPVRGAHVDVWHTDTQGVYSDVAGAEGQTFLRGYQVTDGAGIVRFKTIYPGWYPGRTIHIHFKVRMFSAAGNKSYEFTSQWYMDEAHNDAVLRRAPYNRRGTDRTRNANDAIYLDPVAGKPAGRMLTLALSKTASRYFGSHTVVLAM